MTLDLDFADIRTYQPGTHPGIIVLRPRSGDTVAVLQLLRRTVIALVSTPINGALWICDTSTIRIRSD